MINHRDTEGTEARVDRVALVIGNSRLHWGWFKDASLDRLWHTQHLLKPISPVRLPDFLPPDLTRLLGEGVEVMIASVVAPQGELWREYPTVRKLTLRDISIGGLYSTLGIDRALALLGAASVYGYPSLVIDAGTALTLTGITAERNLAGGAILPGIKTQFESLYKKTAALPNISLPSQLPSLWAIDTAGAIEAGIIYCVVGGVSYYLRDWWGKYPGSAVIITGGDGEYLAEYLGKFDRTLASKLVLDDKLLFWGVGEILRRG